MKSRRLKTAAPVEASPQVDGILGTHEVALSRDNVLAGIAHLEKTALSNTRATFHAVDALIRVGLAACHALELAYVIESSKSAVEAIASKRNHFPIAHNNLTTFDGGENATASRLKRELRLRPQLFTKLKKHAPDIDCLRFYMSRFYDSYFCGYGIRDECARLTTAESRSEFVKLFVNEIKTHHAAQVESIDGLFHRSTVQRLKAIAKERPKADALWRPFEMLVRDQLRAAKAPDAKQRGNTSRG